MQLTCDPSANIAYIRLKNKTGKVNTVSVSDELNIDLAPDGSVYGIEFLNASEQLRAARSNKITLVNKISGKKCELPIAG
jgi:uncharacterized protein YuzE